MISLFAFILIDKFIIKNIVFRYFQAISETFSSFTHNLSHGQRNGLKNAYFKPSRFSFIFFGYLMFPVILFVCIRDVYKGCVQGKSLSLSSPL